MHQTAAHLLLCGLLLQSNCTPTTPPGGGDGNQPNQVRSGMRDPPQPQHPQPLQPPAPTADASPNTPVIQAPWTPPYAATLGAQHGFQPMAPTSFSWQATHAVANGGYVTSFGGYALAPGAMVQTDGHGNPYIHMPLPAHQLQQLTPPQQAHPTGGQTPPLQPLSRGQYRARRCPLKSARCHQCTSPTPSTGHRQKHYPLPHHHQNWRATTPTTPTRHHPLTQPLAQAPTQHKPARPPTANTNQAQDNRTPAATRTQTAQAAAAVDPQPLNAPAQTEPAPTQGGQHSTSTDDSTHDDRPRKSEGHGSQRVENKAMNTCTSNTTSGGTPNSDLHHNPKKAPAGDSSTSHSLHEQQQLLAPLRTA